MLYKVLKKKVQHLQDTKITGNASAEFKNI